jgi:hypothetical protein
VRESFARRAARKGAELACVHCGSQLGSSTYCPGCRELFPDYLVAETGKTRRRKVRTVRTGKPSAVPFKAERKPSAEHKKATAASSRPLAKLVIPVAVLVLLVVVGTFAYLQRLEKKYVVSYVSTLYLIKSTTDTSLSMCTQLANDWKTKSDAGQVFAPRFSDKETTLFSLTKDNIDKRVLGVGNPPKKFVSAKEKLANLNAVYGRVYEFTSAPPGSLPAFTNSLAKLDSDYRQALKDLKASLPEAITEEVRNVKSKYRELRDF